MTLLVRGLMFLKIFSVPCLVSLREALRGSVSSLHFADLSMELEMIGMWNLIGIGVNYGDI